jgi:hypothetical protein
MHLFTCATKNNGAIELHQFPFEYDNTRSILPYIIMIISSGMWTLPETSEIARPNAKEEEGNMPSLVLKR